MTQSHLAIITAVSVVISVLFLLIAVLKAKWRFSASVMLILALSAAGLAGWKWEQARAKNTKALNDYYAALDEITRGNMDDAEKLLRQAISTEPGLPGARRKLKELKRKKTAEKREKPLELTMAPGSNPGEKVRHPYHKPGEIQIDDYDLSADVNPSRHTLSCEALVTVSARKDTDTADFQSGSSFKIDSVTDGPRPLSYRRSKSLLSIKDKLRKNDKRKYRIIYHLAKPALFLAGGDALTESGSYLRPESQWFPSQGYFDFYCPVSVRIRVPKGYQAISVGKLVNAISDEKMTTYHYRSEKPVGMIAAVIGKYEVSNLVNGDVTISAYLFRKHLKKSPAYLDEARKIVDFYSRLYGPFPYEKLAIAEIPIFPGGYGAASLVMLTEKSFDTEKLPTWFLAHESAHQWWGNSVRPKGPGAGWLSEAFAQYSSFLYVQSRSQEDVLKKTHTECDARLPDTNKCSG